MGVQLLLSIALSGAEAGMPFITLPQLLLIFSFWGGVMGLCTAGLGGATAVVTVFVVATMGVTVTVGLVFSRPTGLAVPLTTSESLLSNFSLDEDEEF